MSSTLAASDFRDGEENSGEEIRPLLSVVVPCYNESEVIEQFHSELTQVLDRMDGLDSAILFVDDGSADDTLPKLNQIAALDSRVSVVALSRNFGHQVALTAGMDFAHGDAVVMMDADLQHPPELIPRLVARWRDGYDVVSALRTSNEGAGPLKNLTSRLFYRVLNSLSSTPVPEGAADFCLLSRRVLVSLRGMRERHRFLRGLVSWVGYERAFVPFVAPDRKAGVTKYTRFKMVAMALDATFSFSSEPLRLALRAGIFIVISGFVYLCWTLLKGFLLDAMVPGYASLIGVTMILGGCQLAFLGLIGEYLARVFEEVKGRPIYLVKQAPEEQRVAEPNDARLSAASER